MFVVCLMNFALVKVAPVLYVIRFLTRGYRERIFFGGVTYGVQ